MKIKVISFDVDGTLVTPLFADTIWLEVLPELVAKHHNISIDEAKCKLYNNYNEIGPKRLEWYDINYWINKYGLDVDAKKLLSKYKHLVTLYPEVIEVLEELVKKYKLIIISNSARLFLEITTEPIKEYFSHIFSTISDFHSIKDSWVYLEICKNLSILPSEIIHIGDSYELDYINARKAGIIAFHLDRSGKLCSCNTISNLKELLNKL
ncbi:MAG: HAD family hydrolase [Candidatus Methanomethylicota archaeon]|jgi:putative hydrolase of the HAD superfamily|uniref:HAD family hydrolase n=1 Tax=Thermoproteota archaeon TaxID=2056631 RepID=A0A520KFH2_9CREN|nr:MAG: HAD family hydrolase [Candidatus Verstraetearchaeota archaeon]TDA37773.1 MAG: HAD family hydrolase [Candidatus Verstraetearchaeota archaeon]